MSNDIMPCGCESHDRELCEYPALLAERDRLRALIYHPALRELFGAIEDESVFNTKIEPLWQLVASWLEERSAALAGAEGT